MIARCTLKCVFACFTLFYFFDLMASELTSLEKSYLAKKGKITYCTDPHWEPYEYIDEQGNHQGIAADYFRLFSKVVQCWYFGLKDPTAHLRLSKSRSHSLI